MIGPQLPHHAPHQRVSRTVLAGGRHKGGRQAPPVGHAPREGRLLAGLLAQGAVQLSIGPMLGIRPVLCLVVVVIIQVWWW